MVSIPISRDRVMSALLPHIGSLAISSSEIVSSTTQFLQTYAPYRQDLFDFRNSLEFFMIKSLHSISSGSFLFLIDRRQIKITLEEIEIITDDLMGVLFDFLTPFSANFIKINKYSMQVYSLSALRVLYQKYESFFSEQEYAVVKTMIRNNFPAYRYESWLQ